MNDNDSIFDEIKTDEIEASNSQSRFSDILDWVIDLSVMIIFYLLLPREVFGNFIRHTSYGTYVIVIAIMILYRLLTILIFGRTVGMIILKIKYLNGNFTRLSNKEKLIAVFAVRTSKIKYYKV